MSELDVNNADNNADNANIANTANTANTVPQAITTGSTSQLSATTATSIPVATQRGDHKKRGATHAKAAKVAKTKTAADNLADMPITEHLIELRAHLIKIMMAIVIALIPMGFFFNEIYYLFSQPLVTSLPHGSNIVATDLVSGFMAQVRLCVMLAIFVVIPFILYQVWSFVAPGLYQSEKRIAIPILVSSILLFYTGVAFAYFIILQRALQFLVTIVPSNVVSMPDMESYLNFAVKIMMVSGVTFEIPVFVFLLVASGIVSAASLADKRRYIIVGCFAAAGVLSPPDVPSMFMLAIPMLFLFEMGLLAARLLIKRKETAIELSD